MGLDMYLTAKMSLYESDKDLRLAKVRRIFPDMYKSGNINYIHVGFEAGYWRKANHIHKWFVTNVQEGKDDCGDYYVRREDLMRLLDICKKIIDSTKLKRGTVCDGYAYEGGKKRPILNEGKILANPELAEVLLPTQGGFFFGSTEYDESYYSDLKKTIEIIEKCLKLPECWSFEYHSSW